MESDFLKEKVDFFFYLTLEKQKENQSKYCNNKNVVVWWNQLELEIRFNFQMNEGDVYVRLQSIFLQVKMPGQLVFFYITDCHHHLLNQNKKHYLLRLAKGYTCWEADTALILLWQELNTTGFTVYSVKFFPWHKSVMDETLQNIFILQTGFMKIG